MFWVSSLIYGGIQTSCSNYTLLEACFGASVVQGQDVYIDMLQRLIHCMYCMNQNWNFEM